MITLRLVDKEGKPVAINSLKTTSRALARSLKILVRENDLDAIATEELEPRTVKFKGID